MITAKARGVPLFLLFPCLCCLWLLTLVQSQNPPSLIVNGKFDSSSGWQNAICLPGSLYNNVFKGSDKVAVLDVYGQNRCTTQKLNIQRGNYILRFQYAATHVNTNYRDPSTLASSAMNVFWDGGLILGKFSLDFGLKTYQVRVRSGARDSILNFCGSGALDGISMLIDNVELYSFDSLPDFIRNGDFQNNNMGDWITSFGTIQKRNAQSFNYYWPANNAIQLDGVYNYDINQFLDLIEGRYKLTFQYAARINQALGTSGMIVRWNREIIQSVASQNYWINTFSKIVEAKNGQNILTIGGSGNSDGVGMSIDNVKLTLAKRDYQSGVKTGNSQLSSRSNRGEW